MTVSTMIQPTDQPARASLLRRALQADAAVVGVSGIALLAGSSALGALFGIPAIYLAALGLAFLPYGAAIGYVASRSRINRRFAWAVIILNAIWAIDSLILLASGMMPLSATGWWFVLVQALIVIDFAIVQYIGLRRIR